MQIPIAQKPGNIINRTNSQSSIESNINNIRIGQQHQTIKSVILPPNYRTMMSSPQKGVDYKLILKPVNIQSQPNVCIVLNYLCIICINYIFLYFFTGNKKYASTSF